LQVWLVVAVVHLLAEHREPDAVVEGDVVAVGARRPEAVDTGRPQPALRLDLVQQLLRVAEQLASRRALGRAVQDRRVLALELPGVEEERPVDVLAQLCERWLDDLSSGERGVRQALKGQPKLLSARVAKGQQRAPRRGVLRAQLPLQ